MEVLTVKASDFYFYITRVYRYNSFRTRSSGEAIVSEIIDSVKRMMTICDVTDHPQFVRDAEDRLEDEKIRSE